MSENEKQRLEEMRRNMLEVCEALQALALTLAAREASPDDDPFIDLTGYVVSRTARELSTIDRGFESIIYG